MKIELQEMNIQTNKGISYVVNGELYVEQESYGQDADGNRGTDTMYLDDHELEVVKLNEYGWEEEVDANDITYVVDEIADNLSEIVRKYK